MTKLLLPLLLIYSYAIKAKENLTFLDQKGQIIKELSFEELKSEYKVHKVSTFDYVKQEVEIYHAFDLEKILDRVYGRTTWKNSYTLGTVSTDNYAPIIKNYIFSIMKPYLAFERADGKKFVSKKNFSKSDISLAPYYIIWKTPKAIGNIKKVRDHWPWKIKSIFLYEKEPKELIPSKSALNAGKETFTNHCIACHAINGVGGTKAKDLNKVFNREGMTDKYLEDYILSPRDVDPKSKMPRFPVYLDKKEERIKKLIQYIKDRVN